MPDSKYLIMVVSILASIGILLLLTFFDFHKAENKVKIKGLAIVLRTLLSLVALAGAVTGALLVLAELGFIDDF